MNTTLSRILAIGILLSLSFSSAYADRDVSDAGTFSSRHTKRVTLDYASAEIVDVIRALATQSGVNIAINPNVKGQVTVHLRDKTVEEAIQVVANSAGLGAKKVNDTYVVASGTDMRTALARLGTTRVVPLKQMTAQAAVEMAQGAFPDLTARPQGKAVALVGADEDLQGGEQLIRQNDVLVPGEVHVTESVAVKNRAAAQTADVLTKMTPGLQAEAAGKAVVLSGTKDQVDSAKRSLALLDVQGQPENETRVYTIRYSSATDLVPVLQRAMPEILVTPGPASFVPPKPTFNPVSSQFVNFNSSSGSSSSSTSASGSGSGTPGASSPDTGLPAAPSGSGAATGPINSEALTLVLKGAPTALDQALKLLESLDVAPKQILIESKVVETSPQLMENYGLQWSWTRFGFYEAQPGTAVDTSTTNGPGGDLTTFLTHTLGFGAFSRVPWTFQGILSAMVTKNDAKLLANPRIAVINDQDASIFIGDTLRYQTLAGSSATAGQQFTVVEVPVGIILLVRPRINDDGNVTLRIHPVVSTVTGLVNGLPQTSSREAETSVRLKDGDTLVIGGLIRDEDVRAMSKIPLLGDLPIIGQLFRNVQRTHNRTEVMVVLTVHMIH